MTRGPAFRPLHAAIVSAAMAVLLILIITEVVIANSNKVDGVVLIPGLLRISFVQNTGISFGLFAQDSSVGKIALVVVAAGLMLGLSVWAYRAKRTVVAVAAGVVVGGGLANMIDRAVHGGVFDFLAFHLGRFPLFVCNAPDIAITIGALILLANQIFTAQESREG